MAVMHPPCLEMGPTIMEGRKIHKRKSHIYLIRNKSSIRVCNTATAGIVNKIIQKEKEVLHKIAIVDASDDLKLIHQNRYDTFWP